MSDTSRPDVYRSILGLRAVRSYRHAPIEGETLDAILEAARWTGSSKNRQLWSFVVIDDRDQIEAFATAGDFTAPVLAAPVVIALVQEAEGYEFDSGRLAQNIMLAADAHGVASCPVTLHREEEAAAILGLPDGARCRYAVALGYAEGGAAPVVSGGRKPMSELAHGNTYGEPYGS